MRRSNTRNRRRREALAAHARRIRTWDPELFDGAEPGHRLAFTSKWNFDYRIVGSDGMSHIASKRPEMPSEHTFACRASGPTVRSRRGCPPTRVDPMPKQHDPFRHGFNERFVSISLIRRRRCSAADTAAAAADSLHGHRCVSVRAYYTRPLLRGHTDTHGFCAQANGLQ